MRSAKKLKTIPVFKSEDEERDFWAHADSAQYIDWAKAERAVFPDLKPSLRTISLRLPVTMIARLKLLANQRDVPYQSLLKIFLAERLEKEMAEGRSPRGPSRKARPRMAVLRQASFVRSG
jgi:predicted DNA binding CopG/RHH family protein